MRKTLVGMLVLASLLTGSAESQELSPITAVTMAPDHIRGGQTALATVTLGSPAPIGGTVVTVFSLHLSVILVGDPTPSAVTVPAGASSVQFRVAALPLDTTVSTFMGASVGGQTVYGRLTVWRGPLWQSRIAVFRPGSAEWFLRNEEKRGNVGCL